MRNPNWTALPSRRSERARIGRFDVDVWPIGGGARYSVFDNETLCYVKGGKCADVAWAKEVSATFAQSLIDVSANRSSLESAERAWAIGKDRA